MAWLEEGGTGSAGSVQACFIQSAREAFDAEVFAVDRELRYVLYNDAHDRRMRESCGTPPVEGVVITDLLSDSAARSRLHADLHRALTGESHTTTGWWSCIASPPRLVEFNFAPVPGPDGLPIGAVVMMREGTALADREAAFTALERRYEAILRASADGVAILRQDGKVIDCNDAFAALIGTTVEEALLGEWADWVAVHGQGNVRSALLGFFDHQQIQESAIRRRNGAWLAVEIAGSPIEVGGAPAVHLTFRDITERRRAAEAVAESEARLRAIFSHAPIGLGVMDLNSGIVIEANAALLQLLDRSLEDLSKIPFPEITHPDDAEEEKRHHLELRAGEASGYTMRKRYIRPDGVPVPVEARVALLPEVLGRPPMILGMVTDLRNEAEAEASLRASEERYRRLAENARDIIYRYNISEKPFLEFISPAVERYFGITPAECYADPTLPFQRVYPEDRPHFLRLLSPDAELGEAYLIRWTRPDGTIIWMEHRGAHIRDGSGLTVAIEGIARDVTDRVLRDERVRLLARAIEQAAEVVIITDRNGRIIEVNDAFVRTTGYTRQEALGGNPRLLKSGVQDEKFYHEMWTALTNGKVFTATVKNRRKDGTLYDAELTVSPVRSATGEVTHYVGLQRDVTLERSREEQLRQAQKMEAMGQVTGGIAHDFNNLLTVILANATLLGEELIPGGDGPELLRDLGDAARHGSALVRQLLAFGRNDLLAPTATDLNTVVPGFLEVLRRILPETISLPPVEGTAPPALADRAAVEQMLLNLATNARDALPKGGKLSVHLGTSEPGAFPVGAEGQRYATITVRDNGSGMDEVTRRRAFEPFYTTKPAGKGTGLGLPMVFGIMKQHQGWVDIESTPGKGTSITLGFPIAATTATRSTPTAVPRPIEGALPRTILLVEDNDALLRIAKRLLERSGIRVLTAMDGDNGFVIWHRERDAIDLILSDAVMPGCSGPEMVRRIRAAGGSCPIILASGYTPDDYAGIEGEVTLIAKPWTKDQLFHTIGEAWPPSAA